MKIKWFWTSRHTANRFSLQIDFTQSPSLPRDAVRVLRHNPVHDNSLTVTGGDLVLEPMPGGVTYEEYFRQYSEQRLCDALVLDALIEQLKANTPQLETVLRQYFGTFAGQIFFLGTTFQSNDGRECVPFLNLHTSLPALRYMCPVTHPIRDDILCYACLLNKEKLPKGK